MENKPETQDVLFEASNGSKYRVSPNRLVFVGSGVNQETKRAKEIALRERVYLPIMSKRNPLILVERVG